MLESLGHAIEDSYPEALFDPGLGRPQMSALRRDGVTVLRVLGEILGRPVTRDDVEPYLWQATETPSATADEYIAAQQWLFQWRRRVVEWWSIGFNLLLTPTVWEPPATLESMTAVEGKLLKLFAKVMRHVFFTSPFNITGQPAISLPLHWTPEGLPVGVQLVAAMGREDLLIRIAAQLEQELPWIDRLPPVHA
jgi:amidase